MSSDLQLSGETPIQPIPEKHQLGLRQIITVPDNTINELCNALSEAKPSLNYEELAEQLTLRVKSLDRVQLEGLTDTLVSLCSLRTLSGMNTEGLASYLKDAIPHSKHLADLENKSENLLARLNQIFLQEGALSIAAKSIGLLTEFEHLFVDARIVTDVRPIFKTEVEIEPAGAVIVHSLRLDYHEGRTHKTFYLGLDNADLDLLIDQLKRAQQKATTMRKFLDRSGLPYLDVE